jgi:hypothetical protein
MIELDAQPRMLHYTVYEWRAFGSVRLAAEIVAASDGEALKKARKLVPGGASELRQGHRTVCRYGAQKS